MNINIINGSDTFLCENIGSLEGFEFPEDRLVIEDIPARDGALYIGSRPGRRLLSWEGLLNSGGMYAARRELIRACRPGNLKTIKFTTLDNIPLQAEVEFRKPVMPYTMFRGKYLLQAIAPDFRFYSQTESSQSTGVTEAQGGLPVPAAIPGPIGGGSSANVSLTNDGNENTYPTFTIRGPGSNFVVRNVTTGQQFTISTTITATESIVVNTNLRTAFLGSQNVFGDFSGDWMYLQPGVNNLLFNAGAGKNDNTRLTIAFRSAYLGI